MPAAAGAQLQGDAKAAWQIWGFGGWTTFLGLVTATPSNPNLWRVAPRTVCAMPCGSPVALADHEHHR